ncbi:uncharacterized protein LOC127910365 isoform X7 [Oncorhynchus keta]|uniref:uncharacterized protein LOC127910365 isoform X7 n=1 Tax=Oncorhynchus keta TaxID=8018 RepID=UPI00227CA6EB|nr:uncharacterized protein LOC127910365 isoform X7 [Oncorhynchus keta]
MTPLGLVWIMVCLMTTVSCQTLSEPDFVRYPRINDTEVLTCECSSRSCQTVFWFRTLHNNLDIQFLLLSLNNAGRTNHEASVDKHRFQASKRDGGSKMTFTLHIINISSEDAGLYTCVLQNQKENELWRPGVLLRPGETRPTLLPVTKPQPQGIPNSIPNGRCTKSNYQTPKGCGSKVLWPLVGVLLALAVAPRFSGRWLECCWPWLWLQGSLAVGWSAAGPGCGSKVLWPLVGVLLALAVAPRFSGRWLECCWPWLWLQGSMTVGWSAAGPGCGSKVLWPLVGVLLALAVAPRFSGRWLECCWPWLWLQGSLAVGWSAAGPGCGSKVLWPLVGVLLDLAVAPRFYDRWLECCWTWLWLQGSLAVGWSAAGPGCGFDLHTVLLQPTTQKVSTSVCQERTIGVIQNAHTADSETVLYLLYVSLQGSPSTL